MEILKYRPDVWRRDPVFQAWLYPILGVYRFSTDLTVARPVIWSTTIALLQSGIITGGYIYISFKYVRWFVTRHLLNFSYFNLRPLFQTVQYVTGKHLTTDQMEWATAALLTLFQAGILSDSLIGYRIRAQAKKAGEAVLSARPRTTKVNVQRMEQQERNFAGNFLWRFAQQSLWNAFVFPIYAFPVIGQVLYATMRAPAITSRYVQLLDGADITTNHYYSSIAFGLVAGLLSSLPLIGHILSITNTVGAALWIQDLEDSEHNLSDQGSGAEKPKNFTSN